MLKLIIQQKLKKNHRPYMAGEYAVYSKKHWWNKWVERRAYADLEVEKRYAEKLVELPVFFHSNWY